MVPSSPNPPPTLLEFVSSTPPPLTYELVALAPYIQTIRHCLEIFSWESAWEESWLALGAWWALCLFSEPTLKYVPSARQLSIYLHILAQILPALGNPLRLCLEGLDDPPRVVRHLPARDRDHRPCRAD